MNEAPSSTPGAPTVVTYLYLFWASGEDHPLRVVVDVDLYAQLLWGRRCRSGQQRPRWPQVWRRRHRRELADRELAGRHQPQFDGIGGRGCSCAGRLWVHVAAWQPGCWEQLSGVDRVGRHSSKSSEGGGTDLIVAASLDGGLADYILEPASIQHQSLAAAEPASTARYLPEHEPHNKAKGRR